VLRVVDVAGGSEPGADRQYGGRGDQLSAYITSCSFMT
jgi:hypothetical protein